jgi:hypothetical protein
MEKKKLDNRALEVLFPTGEVELAEDCIVQVRPLSLKDLPLVADSFGTVMKLSETGSSPSEIAAKALQEVINLIQYCIDVSPEDIPASAVPEILELVVMQNMSSDIIKKWMALVQKMQSLGTPEESKSPVESQSQK